MLVVWFGFNLRVLLFEVLLVVIGGFGSFVCWFGWIVFGVLCISFELFVCFCLFAWFRFVGLVWLVGDLFVICMLAVW